MGRLSISLFGPFQANLANKPLTGFESDKARALLAYLAMEVGRPHRREMLAGLLWPEFSERSARANLRTALANLRRVIGDHEASPPFMLITRQTIQFNSDSNYELDVALFRHLTELAQSNRCDATPLEEAMTLYRGAFLAGFSLPDSPPFEEWLILRREELARQAREVLQTLSELFEHHEDYEEALTFARRWVAMDSFQEKAHRQVMRLLVLTGQRTKALIQYESCRRTLAKDLGIEPDDETTKLYDEIRSRNFRASPNEQSDPAPIAHNLPHPLTSLIGREKELAHLNKFLADPDVRLLTVVGPGGMGKTHLALEAARAQIEKFPHGVYMISLTPLQPTGALISAIVETLPLSFTSATPIWQQLLDYIRQKRMLLVLDNFEHLLGEVGLIVDALQTAPGLKVLATSRTKLNVQGEQLYPLSGLTYSSDTGLVNATKAHVEQPYSAVALFERSAKHVHPAFALTDGNLIDVASICRLARGTPLAILLASAWIELLTPGEIAGEIEKNADFLRADWPQLPKRHRSLQAVFDQSWRLLNDREQRIFQQLSVFRGSFTSDAAQKVSGSTLTDLLRLVSRFFVHRTSEGRYEIHEFLRQFAAQKLAADPADERTARDRHCAYYAALLQQREADLKGARQQQAMAEIDAERQNIRAAWQWAIERSTADHLGQAANSLGTFFEWRGGYQEGADAYGAAATQLRLVLPDQHFGVLIKILRWQFTFNRLLGNADLTATLAQQGLDLLASPALADQDIQLDRAAFLLEVGQQTSDFTEASNWLRRGLDLYRATADDWGTGKALHLLGDRLDKSGAVVEGRQLLEESLQLRRNTGDERGLAETLETLGFILMRQGQAKRGEQMLRQGMKIRHEIGDKATAARNLTGLATGLIWYGRFAEARTLLDDNLRFSRDLGNRPMLVGTCNLLCVANLHLGQYELARQYAEDSLQLCREIDDARYMSFVLWFLGNIDIVAGEHAEAERILQESVQLHEAMEMRNRLHDVRVSLGYAAWGLGKSAQSRQNLCAALQIALQNRLLRMMLWAVSLAALHSIEQGKAEKAVEIYALASNYPHVSESRWFEDVVGRRVGVVAAKLPRADISKAHAKGQARDLWQTGAELLAEFA